MAFSFEKRKWPKSGGTHGVNYEDALPSYVCLLNLDDLCAYGLTGEYAGAACNVAAGRILDSSCVIGCQTLVGPKHGLVVGWIGPMVMIDILRRGGVGLVTIRLVVHDCRVRGRMRGERGQTFGR